MVRSFHATSPGSCKVGQDLDGEGQPPAPAASTGAHDRGLAEPAQEPERECLLTFLRCLCLAKGWSGVGTRSRRVPKTPKALTRPRGYDADTEHPTRMGVTSPEVAGGRLQRDGGDDVEPVSLTIGGIVAALVLKVAEKAGDQATETGWAAVSRLVERVRRRFRDDGDVHAEAALAR